jgi:hypothetical protein
MIEKITIVLTVIFLYALNAYCDNRIRGKVLSVDPSADYFLIQVEIKKRVPGKMDPKTENRQIKLKKHPDVSQDLNDKILKILDNKLMGRSFTITTSKKPYKLNPDNYSIQQKIDPHSSYNLQRAGGYSHMQTIYMIQLNRQQSLEEYYNILVKKALAYQAKKGKAISSSK